MRHHPLATSSLAPFGFATSFYAERLDFRPPGQKHYLNPERLIAKLWERAHLRDARRPHPIQAIIHTILPSICEDYRAADGDFLFLRKPYSSRDIMILSSAVQWLGTNCGMSFLTESSINSSCDDPQLEFATKFERLSTNCLLTCQFTHECSEKCGTPPPGVFMGLTCRLDPNMVSVRDKALIKSLMLWLGTSAGRRFLDAFILRRNRGSKIIRRWQLLESGLLPVAA
jgi:hypothetical protein